MVITLIEYAIYLQAITAHNGDELDPHGGNLNTFIPLHNTNVSFYLSNSRQLQVGYLLEVEPLKIWRTLPRLSFTHARIWNRLFISGLHE